MELSVVICKAQRITLEEECYMHYSQLSKDDLWDKKKLWRVLSKPKLQINIEKKNKKKEQVKDFKNNDQSNNTKLFHHILITKKKKENHL